jgi:AcrR family transcriptional regulator
MTIESTQARRPRKAASGQTRAEKSLATRERILDVAEVEFSRHGFDGVTLRTVAKAAKVDTALLHYYFESKAGLFNTVFMRRAEALNEIRIAALADYEASAGDAVTVEGAVEAFVAPLFERCLNGGPGWRAYFALLAVVNNTPMDESLNRYFDETVKRLIRLVNRALPQADEADLYWAHHMLSGALTLSLAQTRRIDWLSGGLCHSSDFDALAPRMIAYAAAGFRAVCR